MKVLLVLPTSSKGGTQIPDLGLGYLATALRKHGHVTDIAQGRNDDLEDLQERLERFVPDIVGIKVISLERAGARRAVALIRRILPSAVIILGGPHVSIVPPMQAYGDFQDIDFMIRGEAELSLPQLVGKIERGDKDFRDVPGIVYRHGDKLVAVPAVIHYDLDDFGYPAWDLIDPRKYDEGWYFWTPELPRAPIITSRGCPYKCTFCAQNIVGGKRVRQRSLNHVLDEMELLMTQYGVRNFDFLDDNFLMDYDYVKDFCEEILARGWQIKWNCAGTRLDCFDVDLVKLMDRAGCTIITVGYESGSQRLLNYMKKHLDLEFVRKQTKMIAENTSIRIYGMFILGYPTETIPELRRTIRFASELPLYMANFSTYMVLPGCEETDKLLQSGEIKEIPWDQLGFDHHVYAPKGMTFKQLQYYYVLAYWRFYSQPVRLIKILGYSWTRLPSFLDHVFHKMTWKRR